MARRSIDDEPSLQKRRSPARTPEERESLLMAKSLNLIEKQIDDGTVSAQVLAMYARHASTREKLEQEKLRNENELLQKKVESLESALEVKDLMSNALSAFRGYTGEEVPNFDDDDYDD